MQAALLALYTLVFTLQSFSQIMSTDSNDFMKLSLHELYEATVSSVTRHDESVNDIPATVYVIEETDINNFGFYDLKQILQHTSGIEYSYPHSWLQGGQRGITGNWSNSKLLTHLTQLNNLHSV